MQLGKLEMERRIDEGQTYEDDTDFVTSRIEVMLAIYTYDAPGKAEYAQVARSGFEMILQDIERKEVDIWRAYAVSQKLEAYVHGSYMLENLGYGE